MSQETMEGEVAVAVMEEKPSPFLGGFILDSAALLLLDELAESAWTCLPAPYDYCKYFKPFYEEKTKSSDQYEEETDIFGSMLDSWVLPLDHYWATFNFPNTAVKDSGDEVKFSISASTRGFDIKIGSQTMHAPKYTCARHALVYLILFARNLVGDTFACPKSMVPRSILDNIRRSRSASCSAGETPVESIGVYAESEPGSTAMPSATSLANSTEEDEDAAYHDDAMGDADTLPDMESIATGLAPAASLHEQNKIMNSRMNGSDNYTGYMDGVHEVTHTKPEHHRTSGLLIDSRVANHSVMEAAEKKTASTWVVATAASHHATGNRDLLSGFTPDQPGRFVESADGSAPMQVLGHGSVITDTVVLPNVLYVPGLTANLVSASQLAELDYTVGFSRGACHIRSAADGTIVGKASVGGDGLFQLDFLQITGAIDKRPVI